MSIDIFNIEPTKVSRDLRGKIVLLYGEMKSGKTSNAVKFPRPLLLAAERGYNALSGVRAQNIDKWTDFKRVLKQLRDPRAQKHYETIILDTVDIFYDLCEAYICSKEGVDKIGDIPYGAGYRMVEKEYDEAFRSIPMLNFGLVMISHSEDKQFTDENGQTFNKIVPTLPKTPRKIVLRMADIVGYSRIVETEEGNKTLLYMRGTSRFEAGSRWKYTPPYIEFNYDNLTNAIANAIEKEEKENGAVVVDEHINAYEAKTELNYDELMGEVKEVIDELLAIDEENDSDKNSKSITRIVESHLGKGRRLSETDEDQVDIVALILEEINELLESQLED